jgi:hypothetical protein
MRKKVRQLVLLGARWLLKERSPPRATALPQMCTLAIRRPERQLAPLA